MTLAEEYTIAFKKIFNFNKKLQKLNPNDILSKKDAITVIDYIYSLSIDDFLLNPILDTNIPFHWLDRLFKDWNSVNKLEFAIKNYDDLKTKSFYIKDWIYVYNYFLSLLNLITFKNKEHLFNLKEVYEKQNEDSLISILTKILHKNQIDKEKKA